MNLEQKVNDLENRVADLEKQVAAGTTTSIDWQRIGKLLANVSKGKERIRGTVNYR